MSFAAPESGYDKTHNFLLEKIAFGLFNFQRALFSEKSKLFDYNKTKEKVNYIEVISKLIQKMAKKASQRAVRSSLQLLSA